MPEAVLERPDLIEQPANPSNGEANLVLETPKSKRDRPLGYAIGRIVAAGRYPDRRERKSRYAYRLHHIVTRNQQHGISDETTDDHIEKIKTLSQYRETRGQLTKAIRNLIDFKIPPQENKERGHNNPL